jgi:hypothetical protein
MDLIQATELKALLYRPRESLKQSDRPDHVIRTRKLSQCK